MNMVIHDLRSPSECIQQGLLQAQQIMQDKVTSLLKQTKDKFKNQILVKRNEGQWGLNQQNRSFLARNSQRAKSVPKNRGVSSVNLSKFQMQPDVIQPRVDVPLRSESQIPIDANESFQFMNLRAQSIVANNNSDINIQIQQVNDNSI